MQNKTKTKQFSKPEYILKSAKNILEERSPKENSSKTIKSKVLSKNYIRKKNLKQQYNFCKAKSSLEFHGMY